MIYFPGSNDLFPRQQWFISKIAMIYFTGKMISEWFISQVAMNYFTGKMISEWFIPRQQWIISKIAMIYLPSRNKLFPW